MAVTQTVRRTLATALAGAWLALGACHHASIATAPNAVPSKWTRGATCYEIFVRSFYDSDGDGVGDLRGLTEKLDYVNDGNPSSTKSLGARCIWLMPVAESPSYHGYDVADYYRVDREYGTQDDFKRFMSEAHRRGIHVLVDMVLNHSSSQHPYFKAALADTTSPYRDFYRWSPVDPGTKGPWGQTLWHRSPVRAEWYYGIFSGGMPDLNYDKPAAHEEAKKIATFWLKEMAVDGFRLDAVPYLVEEGTAYVGTPGTHAVLREYGEHVRRIAPNSFTVGEVWDSVAAVLPYYPDQLDAYFSFAVSDDILAAVRTGSARGLLTDYLKLQRVVPSDRYAPFLRNHDQTRTLTALGGSVARVKLATTLLFTLPGFPFVYYGEEIGMTGDKPDPRLRTPMQWRAEPGLGFTRGTPWEAPSSDWATTNVAAQESDATSLLALYRRMIHLRDHNEALGSGELVPLTASSDTVASYLRREGTHFVLVVANLGTSPLAGASVTSAASALPRGRYAVRDLLDGSSGATLTVGADGRIQSYAPGGSLAPLGARVLDLSLITP